MKFALDQVISICFKVAVIEWVLFFTRRKGGQGPGACSIFTKTLTISSAGSRVSTLQTFRALHAFLTALVTFYVILPFLVCLFYYFSFLQQSLLSTYCVSGTLLPNWIAICLKAGQLLVHSYLYN